MTIHRALGFVDRSILTDDSPLRVVMASEGRMADKIDLRMSGADLRRFRGNPVLGYGHSYWGRTNLPIGRVNPESLTIDGTQLSGELEFDEQDEFALLVERKLRGGYLNAVSIGFEVLQWESAEDNYWRGGVATKWELTELSVVPVPMDASALVTSGRGLADPELIGALRGFSEEEFARLIVRLQAVQNVAAGRGPFVEPFQGDLEPPAGGVPTDTARGLLEAFTITKESHA
jgi:HK97 family phage prohead protease